jgi:hypothetical protein
LMSLQFPMLIVRLDRTRCALKCHDREEILLYIHKR